MSKSKEVKIGEALGGKWSIPKFGGFMLEIKHKCWVRDTAKGLWGLPEIQTLVSKRVQELLDELGLIYNHRRNPYENNKHNQIEILDYTKEAMELRYSGRAWTSGWVTDSELPEKKEELLLWLAKKGELSESSTEKIEDQRNKESKDKV